MANPFLGAILGSVLGQAMGRSGMPGSGMPGGGFPGGGFPGGGMAGSGGMPGGLGGILGGALGGSMGGGLRGRNAMLALLLPLALQWIQRNGGIGNVLQRTRQRGYSNQASSWVGTGENEALPPQAVDEVFGRDEIARMSQQLGVGEQEVSEGLADILPEVVDKLSPEGQLPQDADRVLDAGQSSLDELLRGVDRRQAVE
ncbi:DUF937 domain-containing protein [Ramlibacter henchirensis]|uniref:DUF937 domain-containing protein n=1 Tax=Ramlibacter henchirensis TaxID=204072 RepID=A0A4Z0BWZ2_9BURK|nr:YidB family protein [Ramlibacter henchirensis]TFZ02545.1 DUF937 domain-containing protein [Ramlibacter henchirensis]